jgi:hypothetical protein
MILKISAQIKNAQKLLFSAQMRNVNAIKIIAFAAEICLME